MSATISQAGEPRAARLESVRALAALGVLAFHTTAGMAGAMPGVAWHALAAGRYGVYVFFTLSGFLLFRPFVRYLDGRTGRPRLREYALNRALRILPLYYVVVGVVLATHLNGGRPGQLPVFALFLENFFGATAWRVDTPMWSLVVEVQFYLLLPLLAVALARLAGGSRRVSALVIAGLALVSLSLYFTRATSGLAMNKAWYGSLPPMFFFFAAGMLLALVAAAWSDRPPQWFKGPLVSADVWVVASAPLWVVAAADDHFKPLIAVAAALVVAACVLPPRRGVVTRVLEWRVVAVLGISSYSLYLWHVPVLHALWTPGEDLALFALKAVGASIAVGFLSYALIESPFLRLRKRWVSASPSARVRERAPAMEPLAPVLPPAPAAGRTP